MNTFVDSPRMHFERRSKELILLSFFRLSERVYLGRYFYFNSKTHAGRPSPASSSSSGKNLTRAASFYAGTSAAKGGLSEEQSLPISLNSQNSNVNHESSDSYNVNNSVASQRITSDNDLNSEILKSGGIKLITPQRTIFASL